MCFVSWLMWGPAKSLRRASNRCGIHALPRPLDLSVWRSAPPGGSNLPVSRISNLEMFRPGRSRSRSTAQGSTSKISSGSWACLAANEPSQVSSVSAASRVSEMPFRISLLAMRSSPSPRQRSARASSRTRASSFGSLSVSQLRKPPRFRSPSSRRRTASSILRGCGRASVF
jgi:hypothetical protein